MKKFVITLFAMIGLCSVTFAEDAFIGWECKDNAALKAAIAKSNDDVSPLIKAHYALLIANNENPANVDTLAKCTEIVKNAYAAAGVKNVSEDSVFFVIIQNFWCRHDKTILKEIVASPLSAKSAYFKEWYIVERNWTNLSEAEYKDVLFEVLKQNVKTASTDNFSHRFSKYLELCIEDEDSVVVKKLQILYRLAIPKLATNEKMKPVVVTISLALKGYGVEVK